MQGGCLMPVGLGPNSPITLQLTRENFNALIGRHSQPVRWLVAENCPCVTSNLKIDENCVLCSGKGVTYYNPTESFRIETFTAPIDGVIEQTDIIWVRDFEGNEYTITSQDCVAYVTGVKRGYQYQVKYKEDLTLSGTGKAIYVGDNLYKIDIPTQIDFGEVQGDLLTVTATTSGNPLTVTNIFRNYFEISEATLITSDGLNIQTSDGLNIELPTISPVIYDIDVEYTYVNPFNFALIHNNFTKTDQKFLTDINGDGLLVFPQRWEVYEKDIIIALNATEIKKVTYRSTGDIDTLPSFYLNELKSAYAIRSGVRYTFTPEIDFVIYKGNQIQWVNNPPTENEQISMTYSYNVAYRVMSDLPDPRTSEDNRFPRKVALKIYTDFNSREGI